MPTLDEARAQVALANRILAHEGVLDAFGHVSVRHPSDPARYLLARSRSPELIEPADVLEFTLDSQPTAPTSAVLYGERVIHGEIYRSRPDVHAVCHHHARAVMPFCISGVPLRPVDHLGATMGAEIPFRDTDLIVAKPESAALWRARSRHGATVAGTTLEEWCSARCSLAATPRCSARRRCSAASVR
jgi:HCOMODA/2-hydroxy-3-carboxy-muconic semialdehyde decarboxylase